MKEYDKWLLRIGSPFRLIVPSKALVELEGMRSKFAFIIIAILCLASCTSKPKDTRPVVGNLDSAAIAADTTMQLGLEQSYEFIKTLTVTNNVVYDVIAWGTPSKGLLCFVYRDEKGVLDTVLETTRLGIIKDCWVSDMNKNGKPEVIAVLQNNDSQKLQTLTGVEVDAQRNAIDLKFDAQFPKDVVAKYKGNDKIEYVADDKAIYHQFPLMDSTVQVGTGKIKYVLKGNKFEAQKFEQTKN